MNKDNIEKIEILGYLSNGLRMISQVDNKTFKEVETLLIGFYKFFPADEKSKDLYKQITTGEFNFQKAKKIFESINGLKEYFFKLCIILACIDSFSEGEYKLLVNFSSELDFPIKNLHSLIDSILEKMQKLPTKQIIENVKTYLYGYVDYLRTGYTTDPPYKSMRNLYRLTNGNFNDYVSFLFKIICPPYKINEVEGLLGKLNNNKINDIVKKINENGYYIFDNKLPDRFCTDIIKYASDTKCYPSDTKDGYEYDFKSKKSVYFNKVEYISSRYDFDMFKLIEDKNIQKLLTDETFLALAQTYFGSKPVANLPKMWWSSDYLNDKQKVYDDLSRNALMYHFDMDRIKSLKFFFYLSDVESKTGPHCFIKGSHKNKPFELLKISHCLSDDEILKYYKKEDLVEIIAPKGTIIVTDNTGYHKGKLLESGKRLMLQFQLSIDSFGISKPENIKINRQFSKEFLTKKELFPYYFSTFKYNNK